MQDDIRVVGPRIRTLLPTLTSKEQEIVRNMLQMGPKIEQITISDLGSLHGVSDAMIVKLSKKLGYSGFREVRDVLFRYSQLPVTEMYQELVPDDTAETIVRKVFQISIQALQETLAILDMDSFKKAVEIIANARNRDFIGVGGSAAIARDASHKFLRIGIRTHVYDDNHLMLMSASLLTAGDLVLAISHSGQTKSILDPVRLARSNGATIIALTNYAMSTLAKEADIVLWSTARGTPLMGENAAARIAQLNIIDALFVCVAQQNYAMAEDNLGKTMSSVKKKRES